MRTGHGRDRLGMNQHVNTTLAIPVHPGHALSKSRSSFPSSEANNAGNGTSAPI